MSPNNFSFTETTKSFNFSHILGCSTAISDSRQWQVRLVCDLIHLCPLFDMIPLCFNTFLVLDTKNERGDKMNQSNRPLPLSVCMLKIRVDVDALTINQAPRLTSARAPVTSSLYQTAPVTKHMKYTSISDKFVRPHFFQAKTLDLQGP